MDDTTRGRLDAARAHYHEVQDVLSDPQVASDPVLLRKYSQELSEWQELVNRYDEYLGLTEEIETLKEMAREDSGDQDWIQDELAQVRARLDRLEHHIQALLTPKDPNDAKNVIMEIRAGAGGEEAALFAAELFRVYSRYAERHGWKTELLSVNETDIGGFKEIIFMIQGHGAYSHLKFERGVHRVQRVPVTEAGGRIHTSTVTVAVLPEVEEVEVHIDPEELRIDTMRASGAGGQHVNKTESAVRITHLPTGIVVTCQDEKSQLKNRDKAMTVLRARLKNLYDSTQAREIADERRQQVGTGDRSERIRTYNFPQGRVTDHRVGVTLHRLDDVLDGDIEEIIEALQAQEQEERLQEGS
ncbi:MAG: peptide chain release factor 1 [Sulfobacillus thermosulfidooxidans]|uniref:peptide chain release factor 1 n=1 Tax=Sulfobacillus sp. hq2 TaxID=2039167 RepID=UPI000CD1171E|nr:peptide chain release factor 1 [Sulfobacillus sp. hq2]POB09767.1 peptide chain release factor 1 [Sulfobacillus sp. hq2]PSR38090.1 MAG: peptide chain release factor 1 [Sulfobacillus thermosulfidooxidans]